MSIDIRIMAAPSREEMVLDILKTLGKDQRIVTYDDRPNGGCAMYTAKKTWLEIDRNATHGVVIQDDVEVVNDFEELAQKCADKFPKAIFSFFCGRVQPSYLENETPYINLQGGHCVAGGQAVMMPTDIIEDCFNWIDETLGEEYEHDDAAIGMYANAHNIMVLTTAPSLVQHLAPTKSLVGLNCWSKVSKVYVGKDVDKTRFDADGFCVMKTNFPWCEDNTKSEKAKAYMRSLKGGKK